MKKKTRKISQSTKKHLRETRNLLTHLNEVDTSVFNKGHWSLRKQVAYVKSQKPSASYEELCTF
jgi:hypothetical protein